MSLPKKDDFVRALEEVGEPGDRQKLFLKAYAGAQGRATTARVLAELAGYQNYGGINLQYGLLARQIGRALGRRNPNLSILVEFIQPGALTNSEYILIMRAEFAEALEEVGWL